MTTRNDPRLASIVIATYNYGHFVGTAIQSALDLRWPNKEIVVVDDGSTDGSRAIIEGFAHAGVRYVHQANAGQVSAGERGFDLSRGEILIFLDADDALAPDLLEKAAPLLRDGVSKVQVRLQVIDEDGRPTGDSYPKFPAGITPAKVRAWAIGTGAYPTPPGSGNVYARWFLEKLMPIQAPKDRALDSYCLTLAPYLGAVETIDEPLASYRVHSSNLVSMNRLKEEQFATELKRAMWRTSFARDLCSTLGVEGPPRDVARSIPTLMIRASSLRLRPDLHPIQGDSRGRLVRDMIQAMRLEHFYTSTLASAMFAWTLGILFAPRRVARNLVSWRYAPMTRPALLRRFIPA